MNVSFFPIKVLNKNQKVTHGAGRESAQWESKRNSFSGSY
jgi:hypothetical protein